MQPLSYLIISVLFYPFFFFFNTNALEFAVECLKKKSYVRSFFYYYFLSMGMSWWKMDFYEASLTMVIYYLMLVGLSPSSFWPLHGPLCKVFLKQCFLGKRFGMHRERCAQSSATVSESLDMYSLHRKGHSLALIRDRAQGLNVNVDSPDSQVTGQVRYGVCFGKISGPPCGHRASVSRLQTELSRG